MSIPDLNIVAAYIVNKTKYTVREDIGSDHRPTLIQITYRAMQPQRTWVWRRNYMDGNWVKFREIIIILTPTKHAVRKMLSNKNYRKSVMPSKPLPNNSSHGFTYRFTHIQYKYQQYWTEEIDEHNATKPERMSKETRPMILEQTTTM